MLHTALSAASRGIRQLVIGFAVVVGLRLRD
jgi:hypothetical protein